MIRVVSPAFASRKGLRQPAIDDALGERRHAVLGDDLDALVPEVLRRHMGGGVAEREPLDAVGRVGAEPLTDQAALRQAAEIGLLHPDGVQDRDRIAAEPFDGIGPLRRVRAAMAAAVIADDPEMLAEGLHLGVPHMEIGAERIGEKERRLAIVRRCLDIDPGAVIHCHMHQGSPPDLNAFLLDSPARLPPKELPPYIGLESAGRARTPGQFSRLKRPVCP